MNYFEAKFERERKENPTEWLIIPVANGRVRLVRYV